MLHEVLGPCLAIEVLSPSTDGIERFRKIDEYKRHPTLAAILLVETARPEAPLYRRTEKDWRSEPFVGLEAAIELLAIRARLPLADVYEGLTFAARPRLPG